MAAVGLPEHAAEEVCSLCLQIAKDPRLLECLHSFCCSCLDSLAVTEVDERGQLRCPLCRSNCPFPKAGATGLPKNVCKVFSLQGARCVECSAEDLVVVSTWLCSPCRVALCDRHLATHMRCVGAHVIEAAVDVQGGKGPKAPVRPCSTRTYDSCAAHGEALKFFCTDCDEVVCGSCVAVGEHQLHRSVALAEVAVKRKDAALSYVKHLREASGRAVEAIELLDQATARVSVRSSELRDEIRAVTARTVATVQSCGEHLLQRVDNDEAECVKMLDMHRDKAKGYRKHVENAIGFGERLASTGDPELLVRMSMALEKIAEALRGDETFVIATGQGECAMTLPSADRESATGDEESTMLGILTEKLALGERGFRTHGSAKRCNLLHSRSKLMQLAVGEEGRWELVIRDKSGKKVTSDNDVISVRWQCERLAGGSDAPQPLPPTVQLSRGGHGKYALCVVARDTGDFTGKVLINGERMNEDVKMKCYMSKLKFSSRYGSVNNVYFCTDKTKATVKGPPPQTLTLYGESVFENGVNTWVCSFKWDSPITLGVFSRSMASGVTRIYGWKREDGHIVRKSFVRFDSEDQQDRLDSVKLSGMWMASSLLRLDLDCTTHTLKMTNLMTSETDTITNLPRCSFYACFELVAPRVGSSLTLNE